jgi:uncharacterized membrane protein HdeD (DUF308 family)
MRVGGFIVIFLGICLLFSPIIAIVSRIPLVGSLLGMGVLGINEKNDFIV